MSLSGTTMFISGASRGIGLAIAKRAARDGSNLMMMKDPSLMHPKAQTFSSYPGGHIEGFADSTKHTMMNIYKAILGQGKQGDYPDFNDGVNELLLCEAVCRSHRNQAWEPCEAGEHHDK